MNNDFISRMDPNSDYGMKIFTKHEKMFLRNYCHFAQGDNSVVFMARIALFGRLYRVAWLRILESRQWNNEELFLGFVNFFMGYISNDDDILHLIDERKWYCSEEAHQDVFPDFFKMKEIGDDVLKSVMDKYFPPCTSTEEKLSVTA